MALSTHNTFNEEPSSHPSCVNHAISLPLQLSMTRQLSQMSYPSCVTCHFIIILIIWPSNPHLCLCLVSFIQRRVVVIDKLTIIVKFSHFIMNESVRTTLGASLNICGWFILICWRSMVNPNLGLWLDCCCNKMTI